MDKAQDIQDCVAVEAKNSKWRLSLFVKGFIVG